MIVQANILAWNVRGAANTELLSNVQQFVDVHKPDVLIIVETRVDPSKLKRTFLLLGYNGFCFAQVNGYAGGIIIAWKEENLHIKVLRTTFQFIHVKVRVNGEHEWFLTAVYASPHENNRRLMWDELHDIANSMHGEWLLAGDFNDIASASEKKGGGVIPYAKIAKFVENINKCQLMDLGTVGTKFTWKGPLFHNGCHIFKRLDRALCNDGWRLRFPDAYVRVLATVDYSDHHPILIIPRGRNPYVGLHPFRFESLWLTHESYIEQVQHCWNPDLSIEYNLSHLENKLSLWKQNTFAIVKRKKRELLARLAGIQNKIHVGRERAYLRKLEKKLQEELNLINYQEELLWFQRSRAKWLADGDRNTRYILSSQSYCSQKEQSYFSFEKE